MKASIACLLVPFTLWSATPWSRSAPLATPNPPPRPNVGFLLADDLGDAEFSFPALDPE